MKNDLTEIAILLDRSGSMDVIRKDMEGAFAAFLKDQYNLPGECRMTLYQFDTEFEVVYTSRNIKSINKLDLVPRGATALYDSGCKAVDKFGLNLEALKEEERPSNVIFVIITDGENNTGELNPAKFREKISHQTQNYNWKFIYLGANQDSFATAASLGIGRGQTINYAASSVGTTGMAMAMNSNISAYRCANGPVLSSVDFTDDDRLVAAAGDASLIGKPLKSKKNLTAGTSVP